MDCSTTRPHYDTDLTDSQWSRLVPLVPPVKPTGRKPIDRRWLLLAGTCLSGGNTFVNASHASV